MKGTSDIPVRGAEAHDTADHGVAMAAEGLKLELIAEAYGILRSAIRVSHDEMRTIFSEWNKGELADPLIAMAADILGLRDDDGDALLEKVLDASRGRNPFRWAASLALELDLPAPMVAQAFSSSSLARMKDERVAASAILNGPKSASTGDRHAMIEELRKALLGAFIIGRAESQSLLSAAKASGPSSRRGSAASDLLDAATKSSLDPCLPSLRRLCSRCVESGIFAPCFLASLSYYDGYRSTWLPANMTVALRDSLGGEGFERVDRPRGEVFHTDWK